MRFVFCFVAFIALGLIQSIAQPIPYGRNPEVGRYVKVNGINLYYEIYGTGQPLLLLNGNGGSIAGRASVIPKLSEKYKVITMDSRCHGKTGCSKDLNYEMMASDVNAFLSEINIDSAYIWGHSDGAIVGLIMAYQYPAKVKKLVASGANLSPDESALEPYIVGIMKNYSLIKDTLTRKHFRLMVEHPHINFEKLGDISAPVMIMSGDRDAIRLEHTVKIFQSIPNSQLCILPGTTHFIIDERRELLLSWLNEFFSKKFSKPSTVEWAKQAAKQLGLEK